jgi:hypothetical protein
VAEAHFLMTCSEFVERFSDVVDGTAPEDLMTRADEHLASCASCRRYRCVVERGVDLLRALPVPEVNEDFVPRLQHRIFDVDQVALLRRHSNSGATALAVLGMAVVLSAVAWAPVLRSSEPVIELPPIVVNTPPPAARARTLASFSAFSTRPAATTLESGLWDDARTVLFQYSRLAQRYGQRPAPGRSGLQQDR